MELKHVLRNAINHLCKIGLRVNVHYQDFIYIVNGLFQILHDHMGRKMQTSDIFPIFKFNNVLIFE
jgi:hypothetical protein